MKFEYPVYEDGVIAVALLADDTRSVELALFRLAMRYLPPGSYKGKDGGSIQLTNCMGGETDWFIVPYSFGVAIAKSLIEQKACGLPGCEEEGFERMVKWLVAMEEASDVMCY